MFNASVWRLGEEKVCARIADYMDSEDEWISEYLDYIYDARLHPQPQGESVTNKYEIGEPRLTNRQLIILFEHLLNVTPKPEYINVYSTECRDEILKDLTEENGVRFCGGISADEVLEVMGKSMAVIHTESFDEDTKKTVAYSGKVC